MSPLVSVVIPTYAHADYVLEAVESVLRQGYAPIEVIVVNDGSPDDTEARLAPLVAAGRIRYVRQANGGVAAARNHGASLARGEYLAFLDDDDLWHPDAVTRLAAALERDSSLAMVYGGRVDVRVGTAVTWTDAPAGPEAATAVGRLAFLVQNRIASPGQVLLRRAAFDAVGGFDRTIWGADDWDLWLRLLADHRGARLDHPVLAYRLHAANNSWDTARMWREARRVLDRHVAAEAARDRPILRCRGVTWLRDYLRIQGGRQLRDAAREGAGARLAAAATILVRMWGAEMRARLALKLHLARAGRWGLPPGHPLKSPIGEP